MWIRSEAMIKHSNDGFFFKSVIAKNEKAGISCEQESNATLIGCTIEKNGEHGIDLKGESRATIRRSRVVFNGGSVISKELGCGTICSGNVCTRSSQSPLAPPGFHFLVD